MLIVNQKKSEVYNIQMMKCLYVSHSGDWFFINMDLLGMEMIEIEIKPETREQCNN